MKTETLMPFRAAVPRTLFEMVQARNRDTSAYITHAIDLYIRTRYATDTSALDAEERDRSWTNPDRPIVDCEFFSRGVDHFLLINRIGYERRNALARRAIRLALHHPN